MFKGTCDRIRRTRKGERFWQLMMANKQRVTEVEFLAHVSIGDVLSDGETWEGMRDVADLECDSFKFFKSIKGVYFMQQAGFEFIWQNYPPPLSGRA